MSARKLRVYIAGPYSKPNPNHNTRQAIDLADTMLQDGLYPFLPHLSHFWDTVSPRPYELWMAYDFVWVEACHALFRMPGESGGADRESAHAESLKIPVFRDYVELLKWAMRVQHIADPNP